MTNVKIVIYGAMFLIVVLIIAMMVVEPLLGSLQTRRRTKALQQINDIIQFPGFQFASVPEGELFLKLCAEGRYEDALVVVKARKEVMDATLGR